MSYMGMSHVIYIEMSHVTYWNASGGKREYFMSHMGVGHVTYGSESCHIKE